MALENLFNPKSIAVVGASEEEGKVGNVVAKNILTLGYQGEVYLVNPKYDQMFGKKCYKNLNKIENPVDLAVIAIPAKFVPDEVEKSADRIKNYIIISAGFSEMSEEGKERECVLKKIADEKDLNILGPNCLGIISTDIKLNATFAGGMPEAGNIALLSQSGALAVAILDKAKKENLNFSHIVSMGNKMDIDEAELLEYLEHDEKTKVIGMYLEGIKDGRQFMEKAARVSRTKPVIMIKAGKTEKAQKAISSHTGALAGSDEVITVVARKTGIVKAESLQEFFGLLELFSLSRPPQNRETIVVTNAGGPGVLATDAFKDKEIRLLEIDEKISRKLAKVLPEESALSNPVDVLGDAYEDRYKKVLTVLGKENVGSYICILTPQDQTPVSKIATKIIQFKNKNDACVVASFIGGKKVEKAIKKMRENGIPNFDFPDEAVRAVDFYYQWQMRKEKMTPESVGNMDDARKNKGRAVIARAKEEKRSALYFSEAAEIMRMYGVPMVDSQEMTDEQSLGHVSYPAALKVDSDKVLHKTDKKGLMLGIKNQEELKEAYREMTSNFPGEKIIAQPMMQVKTELILGIKRDEIFGPVLVYGLGGIYTEVLKMVNFLIPPSGVGEIKEQLTNSRINFLFEETRGQAPYDIEELAKILAGLDQFSREITDVVEFDINPLLIYNDGKGAMAVDVKIII